LDAGTIRHVEIHPLAPDPAACLRHGMASSSWRTAARSAIVRATFKDAVMSTGGKTCFSMARSSRRSMSTESFARKCGSAECSSGREDSAGRRCGRCCWCGPAGLAGHRCPVEGRSGHAGAGGRRGRGSGFWRNARRTQHRGVPCIAPRDFDLDVDAVETKCWMMGGVHMHPRDLSLK